MLQKDPMQRPTIADIILNPEFQTTAKKLDVFLPKSVLDKLEAKISPELKIKPVIS